MHASSMTRNSRQQQQRALAPLKELESSLQMQISSQPPVHHSGPLPIAKDVILRALHRDDSAPRSSLPPPESMSITPHKENTSITPPGRVGVQSKNDHILFVDMVSSSRAAATGVRPPTTGRQALRHAHQQQTPLTLSGTTSSHAKSSRSPSSRPSASQGKQPNSFDITASSTLRLTSSFTTAGVHDLTQTASTSFAEKPLATAQSLDVPVTQRWIGQPLTSSGPSLENSLLAASSDAGSPLSAPSPKNKQTKGLSQLQVDLSSFSTPTKKGSHGELIAQHQGHREHYHHHHVKNDASLRPVASTLNWKTRNMESTFTVSNDGFVEARVGQIKVEPIEAVKTQHSVKQSFTGQIDTCDAELGVAVVTECQSPRCAPAVYDQQHMAEYWLSKARNVDDFFSSRSTGTATSKVQVAAASHKLEELYAELDAKPVYSKEERFKRSMKETVDKIIYEVSRRHLDAADKAKRDAEEEIRKREEEQERLNSGGGLYPTVLLSHADDTADGNTREHSTADSAALGQQQGGTLGDVEQQPSIAIGSPVRDRAGSASPSRGGSLSITQRLLKQKQMMLLDSQQQDSGVTGTATAFQSNLSFIVDMIEPSETCLALMEEDAGDVSDAEREAELTLRGRRPSGLETDPFATVSQRVAKAGFVTRPGVPSGGGGGGSGVRPMPSFAPKPSIGGSAFLSEQFSPMVTSNRLALPESIVIAAGGPAPTAATMSSQDSSSGSPSSMLHSGRRGVPVGSSEGILFPSMETLPPTRAAATANALEQFTPPQSDVSTAIRINLVTEDDMERIHEVNCLQDVAQETLRSLRQMYEDRSFQEYIRTMHMPTTARAKESIDVSTKAAASSKGSASLRLGGVASLAQPEPSSSDNDGAHVASDTDQDRDSAAAIAAADIRRGLVKEIPQQKQQQQQQQKKRLDLNNLAKYSDTRGTDGGGPGGSPSGNVRELEVKSNVKGQLIEEGILDRELQFAVYGAPDLTATTAASPSSSRERNKGGGAGGGGAAMFPIASQGGKLSAVGIGTNGASPLPSPQANKSNNNGNPATGYKTLSYWIKNLSTTDCVSVLLTVDPKRTNGSMEVQSIAAMKMPNRPLNYLIRVYPWSMVEVLRWSEIPLGPVPPPPSSSSEGVPDTSLIDLPPYALDAVIIKREKRGAGPEDRDTSTASVGGPELALGGSSTHLGAENSFSDVGMSRSASVVAHSRIKSTTGSRAVSPVPTNMTDASDEGAALSSKKQQQERAELLRQAMALQSRRKSLEDAAMGEGRNDKTDGCSDEGQSRTLKSKKSSRKLRHASSNATSRRTSAASNASRNETSLVSNVSFTHSDDGSIGGGKSLSRLPSMINSVDGGDVPHDGTAPHLNVTFKPSRKRRGGDGSSKSAATIINVANGGGSSTDGVRTLGGTTSDTSPLSALESHQSDKNVSSVGEDVEREESLRSSNNSKKGGGGNRRHRGPQRNRRGSGVVVQIATSHLFAAEGIEVSITGEAPSEDNNNGAEGEDDIPLMVKHTSRNAIASSRRRGDEPLDEEALFQALFQESDDSSARGERRSTAYRERHASVESSAEGAVASADGGGVTSSSMTGSVLGAPFSGSQRNPAEGTGAVNIDALMRRSRADIYGDDNDASPAKRALLQRRSKTSSSSTGTTRGDDLAAAGDGGVEDDDDPSRAVTDALTNNDQDAPDASSIDWLVAEVFPEEVEVLSPSSMRTADETVKRWKGGNTKKGDSLDVAPVSGSPTGSFSSGHPSPRKSNGGDSAAERAARADEKNSILERVIVGGKSPRASSRQQQQKRANEKDTTSCEVERKPAAAGPLAKARPRRLSDGDVANEMRRQQHLGDQPSHMTARTPKAAVTQKFDMVRTRVRELAHVAMRKNKADGPSSLDTNRVSSRSTTLSPSRGQNKSTSPTSKPLGLRKQGEGTGGLAIQDNAEDSDNGPAMLNRTLTEGSHDVDERTSASTSVVAPERSSSLPQKEKSSAKEDTHADDDHDDEDRVSSHHILSDDEVPNRTAADVDAEEEDSRLRDKFVENPHRVAEVMEDLTENLAAMLLAGGGTSPSSTIDVPTAAAASSSVGVAHNDNEQQPLHCILPNDDQESDDHQTANDEPQLPLPSSDLQKYVSYVPPRHVSSLHEVEAELQRREAKRIIDEQAQLQKAVAEIVSEVSQLWPSVATQASESRRSEFFQVSMDAAWKLQKQQAVNIQKLITLLDRKVSTRGWAPRYNENDELVSDALLPLRERGGGKGAFGSSSSLGSTLNDTTNTITSPLQPQGSRRGAGGFAASSGGTGKLHRGASLAVAMTKLREMVIDDGRGGWGIVNSGSAVGGGSVFTRRPMQPAAGDEVERDDVGKNGELVAELSALPDLQPVETLPITSTLSSQYPSLVLGSNMKTPMRPQQPRGRGFGAAEGTSRRHGGTPVRHAATASKPIIMPFTPTRPPVPASGIQTTGRKRLGVEDDHESPIPVDATDDTTASKDLLPPFANRHLLFGATIPRQDPQQQQQPQTQQGHMYLEETISYNYVRAAERLRAIRHERLTYHLAVRLGLLQREP